MRASLHEGAQMLTETWLFLFEPPPTPERTLIKPA